MSAQKKSLNSITDPCEYLKITLHPDGTITRNPIYPLTKPNPDDLSSPVLSKDIPLNPSTATFVRLFLPSSHLNTAAKLPLVVYFHGGGFVLMSADSSVIHDVCAALALQLPALVVSVDYRLGPEHRLPAAYDDGMEVLHWIKTLDEQWLRDYADINNCFLMGTSAGGNLVYHLGLRACFSVNDLKPLKIRGIIMDQPFFGGVQRTEPEMRKFDDSIVAHELFDLLWDLALPIGADRDHEFCNPTAKGGSEGLEKMIEVGWKVMVAAWYGDPLIERQVAVVELMKQRGVEVVAVLGEGGFHGKDAFGIFEENKSGQLALRNFICSCSGIDDKIEFEFAN